MSLDQNNTYPGRKFVQALQVVLVIAIGVFSLMALARPRESVEPETPVATDVPRATEAVATAVPYNPALSPYEQAWDAHHSDNHEAAIELYTEALELDSTMAEAWLGRAVAYEQTGANARLSRNDFWRYLKNMETERIERNIKANQSLDLEMTEGLVYALSFEVQSGDTLNVTAVSTQQGEAGDEAVVDPLIFLVDSEDVLVQANDDTLRSDGTLINMDSSIENYRVLHDGTYTLLVTHAGGGSFGTIDVTLNMR